MTVVLERFVRSVGIIQLLGIVFRGIIVIAMMCCGLLFKCELPGT